MSNIAFDLDDTLVNLHDEVFKIYEKHNIKIRSFPYWDFRNIPKEVKMEVFEMFANPKIMCKLKPFEKSKKLIKRLIKHGHDITIITARHISIEKQTKDYVKKLFNIPCIVVGHLQDKSEIMKELKIEYWVDDNHVQIENAGKAGIKTIMISNDVTEYNHYLREDVRWYEDINIIYEQYYI